MPVPSTSASATLHDVLARFGVSPDEIRDIRSGRVNRHWRVVTAGTTYALRRYNAQRTPAAIEFEHDLLRHVAGQGWPVPPALRTSAGDTIAEADGRRYALFPFLPGRPAPYNNARYLRLKGRLLARLHHDMGSWQAPGQRDGFGRLWELDVYVGALSAFPTFNELLRAFALEQPEAARAIRVQKYACLRELARLGYGELPAAPVHSDFHHDNLLFQRGEITGLLDFDLTRLDARVADIASSIALDCLAPPAYDEIDPAAVRAFVGGYVEYTALSEPELRLIVPLVRACHLWLVAFRLTQWTSGDNKKALASLQRSIAFRFPSFERRRTEMEGAVAQGAAESAR
jgi:homoserine kinase type II